MRRACQPRRHRRCLPIAKSKADSPHTARRDTRPHPGERSSDPQTACCGRSARRRPCPPTCGSCWASFRATRRPADSGPRCRRQTTARDRRTRPSRDVGPAVLRRPVRRYSPAARAASPASLRRPAPAGSSDCPRQSSPPWPKRPRPIAPASAVSLLCRFFSRLLGGFGLRVGLWRFVRRRFLLGQSFCSQVFAGQQRLKRTA